jgi:hypothetical protein
MQLGPADLGEPSWKILMEKIWTSRVIVDSSTDLQRAPRSTMSRRQIGPAAGDRENFSAHIIPLPSKAEAEALAVTLLEREKTRPDSEVVLSLRTLDWINLSGTSSVRALEKETAGSGMTGSVLTLAGAVDNIAFAIGYLCLGKEGWAQDRFIGVAQLQADKIRSRLRS